MLRRGSRAPARLRVAHRHLESENHDTESMENYLGHEVNRVSITQQSRQIAPEVMTVEVHTVLTSRKKGALHAKIASYIVDKRDILLTTATEQ